MLPIYDKPMIYYSLSVLLQAGIQEILLISTPVLPLFKRLLDDGSQWGINLSYAEQDPLDCRGLLIGSSFIGEDPVALILGDNLFYGAGLENLLVKAKYAASNKATIFGYHVENPERYGVISLDMQESRRYRGKTT